MWKLFFILLLNTGAFAQEIAQHSCYFHLVQDRDSFPDCHTLFAANGMYTWKAPVLEAQTIKGMVYVDPSLLVSSGHMTLFGYSAQLADSGSFEYPSEYYVEISTWEVDSLYERWRAAHPDFSRAQIMRLEKISLPPADPPVYEEPEEVEGYFPSVLSVGIVDGYYSSYRLRSVDFTEYNKPLLDSLQQSWDHRRSELEPFIASAMQPFYFSKNEVTNAEYRAFVNWVQDSVAREIIYNGLEIDEEAFAMLDYARHAKQYKKERRSWFASDSLSQGDLPYYLDHDLGERQKNHAQWSWDRSHDIDYSDPLTNQLLIEGGFYYPQMERFYHRREPDPRKWNYVYPNGCINVYPDTAIFTDFFTKDTSHFKHLYFWHPAFDNYPVLAISSEQMKAFCYWKEQQLSGEFKKKGLELHVSVPQIYHYELALKSTTRELAEADIACQATARFHAFLRPEDGYAPLYLNPVGTTYLPDEAIRINEVRRDTPKYRQDMAQFNRWNKTFYNPQIADLYGNVSEIALNLLLPTECFVMSGNYAEGFMPDGPDLWNTALHARPISSDEASPTTGFRLIYTLRPAASEE